MVVRNVEPRGMIGEVLAGVGPLARAPQRRALGARTPGSRHLAGVGIMRKRCLWLVLPLLLACEDAGPAGPKPVACATGDGASQPATPIDLEVGQSTLLLGPVAAATCLSIVPKEGTARYLVSVFNTRQTVSPRAAFHFHGISPTTNKQVIAMPSPAPRPGARFLAQLAGGRQGDAALLERDRALVARRGGPAAVAARARARWQHESRLRRVGVAAATVPGVGDTLPFFIRDLNLDTDCTQGFSVRARAVYVGATTAIFEDLADPMAGTRDAFFQQIGTEFDEIIYPMLLANFGDPLAYDAQLAKGGRVVMLFSPVLNDRFGGVAGFVSACDFFPFDTTSGPDQDLVSNEAAIFYAFMPNSALPEDTDEWQAFVRGVLAHEAKHLASYAARFANGAAELEDGWLEEATAQISSEIYQRTYSHAVWKGNTAYATSVGCEPPLETVNGCTGDRPRVMLHHFGFLYDYLDHVDAESPIGSTDEALYGGAWSFVRWSVDHYASSESAMLMAMTQATSLVGVPNLLAQTGDTFENMVAKWSLASALVRHPDVTPDDPALTIPSWDQRGIFAGMHDQLVNGSTGADAFPLPYPLVPHPLAFGAFDVSVRALPGGGAALFELHSTPVAPYQGIVIRSGDDTPLPPDSPLRVGIIRVE